MGTWWSSEASGKCRSESERVLLPIDGLWFAGEADDLRLHLHLLAGCPVHQRDRVVLEVWVGTLLHFDLSIPASFLYCLGVLGVRTRWQGSEVERFAPEELVIEGTL